MHIPLSSISWVGREECLLFNPVGDSCIAYQYGMPFFNLAFNLYLLLFYVIIVKRNSKKPSL